MQFMKSEGSVDNTVVKLKDLYKDQKSMKFVIHLIRSYLPEEKITMVERLLDTNTGVTNCSLTGVFLRGANSSGSSEVAYTGQKTNTYLCDSAIKSLKTFADEMVSRGDRRITYVLSNQDK